MTTQGQTRTKVKGEATPAQKAALEKARAARSAAAGGGMNIGSGLTQLNKQFENIQQLEKLTQQFWKDAAPYVGSQQGASSTKGGTRGGSSAQHAKAGRKGGQASGGSGQAATG
jgi:hypothetical protein